MRVATASACASLARRPMVPLLTPAMASRAVHKSKIRFCPACGSPTKLAIPDGDEKMRAVCSSCGRVHYENPKMVYPGNNVGMGKDHTLFSLIDGLVKFEKYGPEF